MSDNITRLLDSVVKQLDDGETNATTRLVSAGLKACRYEIMKAKIEINKLKNEINELKEQQND